MEKKRITTSFRLSEKTALKLEALAKAQNRKLANMISCLIEQALSGDDESEAGM